MQLEELEVVPYSLPFREPYVTARGEIHERELLLVRMRGEGVEGLGETAALTLRGGIGIDAIAAEIRGRCWPALLDGGVDPGRIWSAIARCRNRGASAQALAAVDIALHDLVGQGDRRAGLAAARGHRGRSRRLQRHPAGREPVIDPSDGRGMVRSRVSAPSSSRSVCRETSPRSRPCGTPWDPEP